MNEFLSQVFALVCGQVTDNCWAPCGETLPFCQRCTGLYVGSAIAMMLHLIFRPSPTTLYLRVHGLFLLQMVPFGFHWVPQGPILRTVTGQLFGYGVVSFLWLAPEACGANRHRRSSQAGLGRFFLSLTLCVMIVPNLALWGGAPGAVALSWLAFVGLVVLGCLVLINLGCGLRMILRRE